MKKKRPLVLAGSKKNNDEPKPISPNPEITIETDELVDQAVADVTGGLTEKKRKKHSEKYWGDRPEHLRKGLSEMNVDEKRQFYLWKAGDLPEVKTDAEPKPVYEVWEVSALGAVILPMLAERMPVKKEVTREEAESFGKAFTPLVNKYVTTFSYKEEVAAIIFACAFAIPRLQYNQTSNIEING